MKFDRQFKQLFPAKEEPLPGLKNEQRMSIEARADMRRRGQKFKIDALNLERPNENDAIKAAHDRTLALAFNEANGLQVISDLPQDTLIKNAAELSQKAGKKEILFPNLSAYFYAQAAKLNETAEVDFQNEISGAKRCLDESANITKTSPSSLLPDAILFGIQTRQIAKSELPPKEEIAKMIINDPELLTDYALILPEDERAEFLVLIPQEKRRLISQALDSAVSEVLHQSIVEKKSGEDMQRSRARGRLFNELRNVVEKGDASDDQIVKILARAVGELGEDTRQLLLEVMREETENRDADQAGSSKKDYLPRIIKVFLDNFEDWRGNDIVMKLAGDRNTDRHIAAYLLKKLVKNGYIPKDIETWKSERKAQGKKGVAGENENLDIIRAVITDLGVMPSRDILNLIADDRKWRNIQLNDRIDEIKSSQEEFSGISDNHELASLLNEDEYKAMIFYLLHGGDDRFNLINNYSFDKFKEMIGLINSLSIHEKPLRQFSQTLTDSGIAENKAEEILENLKTGKYPLENIGQARQEISFDVSENAAIKNANFEIGRVLGRQQLGVSLLFPLYREYLEQEENDQSGEMISAMKKAHTFSDRLALIDQIEASDPQMREKAIVELRDNWRALGEKMVLELSLEQVFGDDSIAIRGEELMPRLDAKRIDLKRIKKDLLVILKGGNKQAEAIQKEYSKKRKARENLLQGLERQADDKQKLSLETKIKNIEEEMRSLEKERAIIGDQKTMERFKDLTEEEKNAEIEKIGNEILALTEKSPSAIFTYLTMQVLGEDRLRENDISLIQEMESHLQGPFQSIIDTTTYQKPLSGKEEKKRMRIRLEYLDKTERFMNMVRFADSKICCFSSSNYEQTIQHSTANKYWVASINADPMSFVVSMEIPQPIAEADEEKKSVESKENLGFIFGSFGIDDKGKLAIMLNGIYYAPGVEDKQQVETILSGIEKIFEGLPIRTTAIAEQYGGSLGREKLPEGFTNDPVELIRLRALDDGYGGPETKVYDDLSTGEDLNRPHDYGGSVWHKRL